ncbi:MAG: hypothetical protein ACO3GP_06755, partial [Candidatus Limnocylindrus sp.]
MIAAERQGQRNPTISPEHDQTLFNAIEALAGIPGLADQLQNALKGESFLLFSAQISARLRRAGLPPVEAERVQRVMAALATVAAWWPRERQRVQSPADLAALATPLLARREQEELHVAIVDGRNGLLVLHKVYVGTATGT